MVKGMDNSNAPVARFKAFGIEAAVWDNEGKKSVSIRKQYKDEHGAWQDTNTFYQDDLPKLALVAGKAYEFIVLKDS